MAFAAEHQKEGRLEEAERIYRRVLRAESAGTSMRCVSSR